MPHHLAGLITIIAALALILSGVFYLYRSEVKKVGPWPGWPTRIGSAIWIGCGLGLLFSGASYLRMP